MNTVHQGWTDPGIRRIVILSFIALSALVLGAENALAHAVTEGDAGYIQEIWGVNIIPFIYLGAKHMVTGYDHILFLLGVVFFLHGMKDVAIYVSIFAFGQSVKDAVGRLVWLGHQRLCHRRDDRPVGRLQAVVLGPARYQGRDADFGAVPW